MQAGSGHDVAADLADVPDRSAKQALGLKDDGLGNSVANEAFATPALLIRGPLAARRFIFPACRFIGDSIGQIRNLCMMKICVENRPLPFPSAIFPRT